MSPQWRMKDSTLVTADLVDRPVTMEHWETKDGTIASVDVNSGLMRVLFYDSVTPQLVCCEALRIRKVCADS